MPDCNQSDYASAQMRHATVKLGAELNAICTDRVTATLSGGASRRRSPRPAHGAMTAIDFAAFVDRARDRLRRDDPAVLPHRARRREQGLAGGFDPVTAADRAAETAMRTLIRADFPDARHHRRGIRRRARRRRICLGARSDRRHQVLHLRHAGLGHADRADALRRAGLRHDAPAVHARALHRRRRRGALSRPGRRARAARARLRGLCRCGAVHHQPAADERRRPRALPAGRSRRCGCRATAATATPIACWPPATSIS